MNKTILPLEKDKFSIEGEKPFNGYHDPTRLWNGWHCPYFEWDEAVKISEWLNKWKGEKELVPDFDNKIINCFEDPDDPFQIGEITINTEDGKILLYAIGTGWWIWSIHTDT